MPEWLAVLLEIVKLTIPALIVFWTVQTLLKEYLSRQIDLKAMELQRERRAQMLPMKMQAYERLSLLCERINLPSLLVRVRQEGMSARELHITMLTTIQQEYEHNITQQVYVSPKLWEIIQFARDDAVQMLSLALEASGPEATGREFGKSLLELIQKRGPSALDKALLAIKKEAAIILE